MTEPTAEETTHSATALAEPPQPPSTPPGSVSGDTPEPRRKRTGLIVAIVSVLVAIAFIAVVVVLVMNSGSGGSDAANAAATAAAFDSAMQKAGVDAAYPGQPVALADVTATGSHPFSATFSPAEVAAVLNTFPYESDVAGVRISLRNVRLSQPEPGSAKLDAAVTANGGTYSGSVTLPLVFAGGRVDSTGVTALSVEGIPGNDGQKAQVGGALVNYFNAYLAAAQGLTVESASLGADGITVTGSAPDALTFP